MAVVLVLGAGKIGSLIAALLIESKNYEVHLADKTFVNADAELLIKAFPKINAVNLDVKVEKNLIKYIKNNKINAVVSSLPFFLNMGVASSCKATNVHYFDLTEDVAVTDFIKKLAYNAQSAFVPQCGLAPGFINIVANDLIKSVAKCCSAELRVGALPQRSNNALFYALTWSTEGLINEYKNRCLAIEDFKLVELDPLEGLEEIILDGEHYEAFNTSGGIASLHEIYAGKIKTLNYKTIRYPGHCQKIRFLMNDLNLKENPEELRKILEKTIPRTIQDVVILYVSIKGEQNNTLIEKSYFKKIFPTTINKLSYSAIQVSTASSLCAVLDLVLKNKKKLKGLILQEEFNLQDILTSPFGKCFL